MSCCYNIAKRTKEEQAKIRIDLEAAAIAWHLKKGTKKRHEVEIAISKHPDGTRELFRERLTSSSP